MSVQDQATSSMNDTGTNGKIDASLTHDCLRNVHAGLIAMRVKHGAESPIGNRCSTAIEQIRSGYLAGLQKTVAELARLTSQ